METSAETSAVETGTAETASAAPAGTVRMPPVVAFSGYSGSGKTTLIASLTAALCAHGLRVGAIKHEGHRWDVDQAGRDSWRFTRAGAVVTVLSDREKTAVLEQRSLGLPDLLERVRDVDIILVEGWKQETLPGMIRIGVCRRDSGQGLPAPPEQYDALVTDVEPEMQTAAVQKAVPRFYPDDVEGIRKFIMGAGFGGDRETPCSAGSAGPSVPDAVPDAVQDAVPDAALAALKEEQAAGMSADMQAGTGREFTHFNDQGRARMVHVGDKEITRRTAEAAGRVQVNRETLALIRSGGMKKGDVLTVAQVAGIMGAKRTSEVIPMCHPIPLSGIDLQLRLDEQACCVDIRATVSCEGRTGVEMEALTAVSTAALTVYDMCKAVQRDMVISDIRLLHKSGGSHGEFHRKETAR